MPKINVYLPDDLAEAVKESGVPVSAICQRALEQAVRRVSVIRSTAVGTLDADELAARLPHFTAKARAALAAGVQRARTAAAPTIGTGDLLAGLLATADNMALHVLTAMEIEPAQLARDLPNDAHDASTEAQNNEPGVLQLNGPAVNALELAVAESAGLGNNYIGCEHLLLGLVGEPDGAAGRVLRSLGAEPKPTRRAVAAALSGYVQALAKSDPTAASGQAVLTAALRQELQPLIQRIERLEQRAG